MEQNQSLIDFHSHILPGIDDGSRSTAQSLDMMKLELDQGIGRIVATPHFYADRISVDKFLSRRQQAYEKVMAAMDEQEQKYIILVGLARQRCFRSCVWEIPIPYCWRCRFVNGRRIC